MRSSEHDRAMLREHYETVLGVLGARFANAREGDEREGVLNDAAILVTPARRAGMPVSQIADALGLSSVEVVELSRRRGSSQHAHLRVLAQLGSYGGLRVGQLASMLGWDEPWTAQMVDVLHDDGCIAPAMADYGSPEPAFWHLTDRGEGELRYESARLGYPELTRYGAYIVVRPDEASALQRVAARRLGGEHVTVLTPRHTPAVQGRELAFSVFAPNPDDAAAAADRLFGELLAAAGLPRRTALFADLAPIPHPGVAA